MSEIHDLSIENIREAKTHGHIRSKLKDLNSITDNDMEEMITYMKKKYYTNKDSVYDLIRVPIDNSFSYKHLRTSLFFACLYYKANRYDEAYDELNNYVKYLKKIKNLNKTALDYYKCSRDYIGGRAKHQNEKAIKNVLVKFYPEDIVEKSHRRLEAP